VAEILLMLDSRFRGNDNIEDCHHGMNKFVFQGAIVSLMKVNYRRVFGSIVGVDCHA